MAGRIPPEFIDTLLARTDIVDLIHARVPLRKAGKDYQACCPFHAEKTPSFTVSRDKQFYHCFGCGAHGSAIGFLMEYDRLSFRESVEELAHQAGLQVPATDEPGAGGPDLRPLYGLLEQVSGAYRAQLRSHPQAAAAVRYLKERGLSGEISSTFGLGFAPPGWDFLLASLGRDVQQRGRLIECGLVIEQEGRRYDRFRNRITFPIRDRRGRVIGFGGRILGDGKPKYLNSPETPVFHKGRELYGLYEALRAHKNPARLLVVEGYMDVIALAQFGLTYAVATLGTATTPEHLRQLLRATSEVVFCFDGDRAGRAAAWKALEVALPHATGRQLMRFLFLPEGEDPDTLVRREGRSSFEERIERSPSLSELLFDQLMAQVDMASLDGRVRLAELARPLLERVPAGLFREMLDERLASLVGVAPDRLKSVGSRRPVPKHRRIAQSLSPLRLAVALVLQHPHIAQRVDTATDGWRKLQRPGIALLAQLLDSIAAYPDLTTAALIERWRDSDSYSHLMRLADPAILAHVPRDGVEAELAGALERLDAEAASEEAIRLFTRSSPSQWSDEEKERLRQVAVKRHG
jgi:DNA primase